MAKKKDPLPAAARKAVLAWMAWVQADGMFPDPEYDQFASAMCALAGALSRNLVTLSSPKDRKRRIQ